ncbi:MAG TPA: glycosyltransferase [Bacteroidia bacterium]|nr:glycosyltransferase [Bacteroidia bacterium]
MRLLILYEELAPYFLSNIKYFAEEYKVPVLIICKKVNPVAPFEFEINSEYISIIDRDSLSFNELMNKIKNFNPTCLMQAGWIYPKYFEITKQLKLSNNILLLDNQWENTLRQNIGSIYFKIKYKKLFHKAFVPGNKQKKFAKHLGFDEQDITLGFYCCDTKYFQEIYFERKKNNKRNYTFLFVGRYASEKNIELLWQSFIEVCNEYPNNWQLYCAGKGNIKPIQHPQIKHLGFIQPKALRNIILQTDVFILPSKFEPWGVVVHEMTTAGLPIICSSKVGANEFFVRHQENGFIFQPNNKQALKNYLLEFIKLNDDEYLSMCEKSYQLSQKINTDNWIKKIYHLCKE